MKTLNVSLCVSLCVLCAFVVKSAAAEPGPWGTYRGNPQRTGNTDGTPGPDKPAVLWVLKSKDHFIAAPVPVKDSIYLSGVGAFNRPMVGLYPLAAKTPPQPTWTKGPPYLKLASASSPAVASDLIV